MATSARPYQGETAENRVRARRRLLLDTGLALMAADGWRHVTIDQLCREARLNKRYFYESFADLDALAAAIVDDLTTRLIEIGVRAAVEARAAGLDTDALARRVLSAVIGFLVEVPSHARVLFAEGAVTPDALARRHEAVQAFVSTLSAYGHVHHGAGVTTDPIAPLAASLLIGGTIHAVLSFLDGKIPMSREALVDDLAALWVLVGDGAAARARARR